jgi:hypothetical protein
VEGVDHEHAGKISLQEVGPAMQDICICCCVTSAHTVGFGLSDQHISALHDAVPEMLFPIYDHEHAGKISLQEVRPARICCCGS